MIRSACKFIRLRLEEYLDNILYFTGLRWGIK
jgi:hypothetical protein